MAMNTEVIPALALVAVVAAGAFAAKAEPLLLASSQMEAVTAGLVVNVSPQITVNPSVAVVQQLNITNQVAAAVAVATAAGARAAAAAANVNQMGQSIP
jgi:hypothetical protein